MLNSFLLIDAFINETENNSDSFCISHFSCCCDETPDGSCRGEDRPVLAHSSGGYKPSWLGDTGRRQEGVAAVVVGDCSWADQEAGME